MARSAGRPWRALSTDDRWSCKESYTGCGLDRAYAQLEDLASTGPHAELVKVHPTAPSLVLSTGGTTGVPKSILHCSDALVYAARHFAAAVNYTEDDVTVAFAPYGHAGGSIFDIYLPLLTGSSVLPIKRWRVQQVGPLIEKWQGTFCVTMGTHVYDLMKQPDCFDDHLSSVRLITTGAGPDSLFQAAQSASTSGSCGCTGAVRPRPRDRSAGRRGIRPPPQGRRPLPRRGGPHQVPRDRRQRLDRRVGVDAMPGTQFVHGYVGRPSPHRRDHHAGRLLPQRRPHGSLLITATSPGAADPRRSSGARIAIHPVEMEGILARYPGIGSSS